MIGRRLQIHVMMHDYAGKRSWECINIHLNVQIKAVFAQRSPSGGKYVIFGRFPQLPVCQRIVLFSLPVPPFQLCRKGFSVLRKRLFRVAEHAFPHAGKGCPVCWKVLSCAGKAWLGLSRKAKTGLRKPFRRSVTAFSVVGVICFAEKSCHVFLLA